MLIAVAASMVYAVSSLFQQRASLNYSDHFDYVHDLAVVALPFGVFFIVLSFLLHEVVSVEVLGGSLVVGFFDGMLAEYFFYRATHYENASTAAVVSMIVELLFVPIIAFLIFGEHLSMSQVGGIILLLCAMPFLAGGSVTGRGFLYGSFVGVFAGTANLVARDIFLVNGSPVFVAGVSMVFFGLFSLKRKPLCFIKYSSTVVIAEGLLALAAFLKIVSIYLYGAAVSTAIVMTYPFFYVVLAWVTRERGENITKKKALAAILGALALVFISS